MPTRFEDEVDRGFDRQDKYLKNDVQCQPYNINVQTYCIQV